MGHQSASDDKKAAWLIWQINRNPSNVNTVIWNNHVTGSHQKYFRLSIVTLSFLHLLSAVCVGC